MAISSFAHYFSFSHFGIDTHSNHCNVCQMKKIIVLSIIIVCVGLSYKYPHKMLNPGELIEGHQELNNECLSCHNPFWGISNGKCISCHKIADIGKDSLSENVQNSSNEQILFHRKLENQECTSCHTDHKGVKPEMPYSSFRHELLPESEINKCGSCHNQPTDNLHKQVSSNCNNCHNPKGWKTEVVFNHDMIEGTDKNKCSSCHQKPDDSYHSLFKDNCDKCHGTEKWSPSSFDHSNYFQLDHNHNAKCNTCHSNNNFKQYTCYGCHEHSEGKLREEHNEKGIYNYTKCAACHRSGNEHDIRNRNSESNKNEINHTKEFINSNKHEGKKEHDDD